MIRMHCEGQGTRTAAEDGKKGHYFYSLRLSCGGELQRPAARDLVRVGQAAFLADRAFRRGRAMGQWTRRLRVVVPVEEPRRWNGIKNGLSALANFVTGDQWQFDFTDKAGARKRKSTPSILDATCVNLFSGGLDSLCGAAAALSRDEVPFFVTHSPPGADRVRERISDLRQQLGLTGMPSFFANFFFRASDRNEKGKRSLFPERSRGTRPILFLSMAGAIALEYAIPKVCICENGVLAVNLPFRPYLHGAFISRHAHPETLRRFQSLLGDLWPHKGTPKVTNPFADLTKGEQMRFLKGAENLAQQTVSCQFAGQQTATVMHWLRKRHKPWQGMRECGLCTACVVRRAALHRAGIKEPTRHYAFALRTALENPGAYRSYPLFRSVRPGIVDLSDFCCTMANTTLKQFTLTYTTEIAHLSGPQDRPADVAREMWKLYRKFATEVEALLSWNR